MQRVTEFMEQRPRFVERQQRVFLPPGAGEVGDVRVAEPVGDRARQAAGRFRITRIDVLHVDRDRIVDRGRHARRAARGDAEPKRPLAERCEVQVAYAIGVAEPVSVRSGRGVQWKGRVYRG